MAALFYQCGQGVPRDAEDPRASPHIGSFLTGAKDLDLALRRETPVDEGPDGFAFHRLGTYTIACRFERDRS